MTKTTTSDPRSSELFADLGAPDQLVGFSSADHIVFGRQAFMHLHILSASRRQVGMGSRFAGCRRRPTSRLSNWSGSSASRTFNVASNRTLQHAGFRYLFTPRRRPRRSIFRGRDTLGIGSGLLIARSGSDRPRRATLAAWRDLHVASRILHAIHEQPDELFTLPHRRRRFRNRKSTVWSGACREVIESVEYASARRTLTLAARVAAAEKSVSPSPQPARAVGRAPS